jgi:hypothetical protein
MPNYICSKCDLTAHSKNARTRSIFTDDKLASLYSNLIQIKTVRKTNGLREVILTFPYMESSDDNKRPDEELEMDALKLIQEIEPACFKHVVCGHDWELVPGTGEEL